MNKKKLAGLLLGTLALGAVFPQSNIAAAKERPQTVVMTDGEVDDMDSFLRWYVYEEAGTYGAPVKLTAKGTEASLTVPANIGGGETIHIICEAEDNGKIPLKHYARVILTAEGDNGLW